MEHGGLRVSDVAPRPNGTTRRRLKVTTLVYSLIIAFSTAAWAPVQDVSGPPEPPAQDDSSWSEAPLSATAATFDNFNRTVGGGFWGTSSSGAVWSTFIPSSCEGYTAGVDGQSGFMTGSLGAQCAFHSSADQLNNTSNASLRYWDAPSWTFTARFKTTALDGSRLKFAVATELNQWDIVQVEMHFDAAAGTVWGLPFNWQSNAWYTLKWVVVWGDQTRVKVWPASDPEPPAWLGTGTAPGMQAQSPFATWWHSPFGPTSVYVDDYAFGPAPILPSLPPPPGTEDNPPYINGDDAGDPVSTFTGTYTDTHLDVSIPGRGPAVQFARAYNSNDTRTTTLGPGWTHSYNIRLNAPGDATDDIILVGPQGRSDRYVESGGTYPAPSGVHRDLLRNADETYTATDKAQTEWRFDPSGRLTQIRDRHGNASNLVYDGSGRLTTVSDPAGRGVLTLAYTNGLLTSVTDWASPSRSVVYQYDANGRLWKVIDREGKTTTFGYDGTSHRITTVTDARGNVALTTTYDPQGRVATQKDARGLLTGDVTTFDYVVNPDGTRETTLTLPATSFELSFHPTLTDSYDANGWLIQRETTPTSTETLTQSFTYDATGNRTSVTDPRGNTTNFCYDVNYDGSAAASAGANLARVIAPAPEPGANRPTSLLTYDPKNNVIQTVAPKGVPSGQTVTCATDLSAVSNTYIADYAYDAAGANLLAATTRYTDPDTGAKTAVTKYEYADVANPGLVTRVIPPRGNTGPSPDYTYASALTYYTTGSKAGQLMEVTDPLGNKTSYDYDAVGHLISVVDPLGNAAGGVPTEHTTGYTYDKEDRLRFVTQPAPTAGGAPLVSETRYDEVGKPVVRIDANGQVTTYAYDERNSLFQVKESPNVWTNPASPPAGVITTDYTYDSGGNVTRVTRAKGDGTYERATDYAYDGRGLARQETQYPAWPSTSGPLVASTAFDPTGNLLTSVDPLGQTTTFAHDAHNRLTGINYSDAGTPDAAYGYDAHGARTSMTDGTGATSYTYDEADRLITVTSPGPKTVGYRYDLDGNRTKLIYPDATAVTYTFNKASQLASLLDWASRSVTYTYTPDGLVSTATNPNASLTTYSYDNARRLVDIAHTKSGGQAIDRFLYGLDAVGNVTNVANGSLVPQFARPDGLASSNGSWTGTFASINEVVANDTTFIASPTSPTTSHFYEVTLTNVAPPFVTTGTTFRYRYAKSGNNSGKTINLTVELRQGTTVIASQTHTNIPGVTGSGWQQGNVTLTPAQAALVTNVADLRLRFRPSSTGGGQGREAQISWAEVQLPASGNPATQFTYGYDRLYRLTSVTGADGPRSYTYDPAGNRLTKVAGPSTAFSYDRADRILSAGATAVTVDANGNTTAKGADTFGFDQANRMTAATVSGASEAYSYDGDGTRFSRQVAANPAMRYVSDVAAGLPTTIDDGARKYVYGLGLEYAVSGSVIETYHTDRLGSVRALTNAAGTVTATYRSDEWGVSTASTGGSTQPLGFTGEPRDGTGLTYLRARYYDPGMGRFASRDTWPGSDAVPQSLNRFGYVTSNPVTHADPSGHCLVDTAADLVFIAFDLVNLAFGPAKEREANLSYLGLDAAGALVPCVAGAGIIVRLGAKATRTELKLTATVASHAASRPFVNSPHLVEIIMDASKGVQDPQGIANALRWDVPGFYNGKEGTWELVVDMATDTILHFNFVR